MLTFRAIRLIDKAMRRRRSPNWTRSRNTSLKRFSFTKMKRYHILKAPQKFWFVEKLRKNNKLICVTLKISICSSPPWPMTWTTRQWTKILTKRSCWLAQRRESERRGERRHRRSWLVDTLIFFLFKTCEISSRHNYSD